MFWSNPPTSNIPNSVDHKPHQRILDKETSELSSRVPCWRLSEGNRKKRFRIFFELCTLCISIFQALRNRLCQSVFRNSTGNTLFRANFDLSPKIVLWGRNQVEKARSLSDFKKWFGKIHC